jgi:hypothetical protein
MSSKVPRFQGFKFQVQGQGSHKSRYQGIKVIKVVKQGARCKVPIFSFGAQGQGRKAQGSHKVLVDNLALKSSSSWNR